MLNDPKTLTCNQEGCGKTALFRFTWPGKDEAGCCAKHARHLQAVAAAIGLHLQLIPLDSPFAALFGRLPSE